ncbi:MAG: hypothetical protein P1V97_09045 [Planctomycetota bacterium]|nr:hypothetical protein [Planctomycetota bacterium]
MNRLSLLILFTLPFLAACGEIRKTTTKRAAEEMVFVTAAAERSIARFDFRKLKGKKIWVDDSYLKAYDRGFVISCVHEQVVAAGMKRVKNRQSADIVMEVRSAGLGTYDKHMTIGIPDILKRNPAEDPPNSFDELPVLFELGYTLHQGWGLIQAFAYDRRTGEYVFGSKNAWGRSFRGFLFNDIDEPEGIIEGLKNEAK